MRHLKVPYTDVLNMATYERRYFITSLINENQKKQEQIETQAATTSTGNGKRTTKVSGEQLKSRMRNGEVPNQ